MTYSNGKPDLTVADLRAALDLPDNPIGHVRNLVGDTTTTRIEIDVYAAIRVYLGCDQPAPP